MTSPEAKRRISEWFRVWRTPLRKFLMNRKGVPAADVDDVAQEVFLRLLRYEKTELIEYPQAYFFRMATNVAAEWGIRAHRRRPHDARWVSELVGEDRPDEDILRDSAQREIARAVARLTVQQQQVLRLFFFEKLEQAEIARRLGMTPRSVRRHLAKSYQKLRFELDIELLGAIAHGRE